MIIDPSDLYQKRSNWMPGKPIGILIQDSYNNLSFPIKKIQIDNNKINLDIIKDQFYTLYGIAAEEENILPWHYIVEFYEESYTVHNTRPLNLKYPKSIESTNEDIKINQSKILNEDTSKLLGSTTNIENMISVLIIGDSTIDIYTKKLYKCISEYIIIPTCKISIFSPVLYNNILFMNLGERFKPNLLRNYLNV